MTESENNLKVVFRFLDGFNSGQVFHQGLVNLSDFLANNIVGNEGLEPIFRELFVLVVIMLDFGFFFSEDLVSFEISIGVGVSTGDDVVDFFKKRGVSLSELDFDFGDFSSEVLVDLSLLDDVVVEGDGLDLLFQSGEGFDFLLNLLFNCNLQSKKMYLLFDVLNVNWLTMSAVFSTHFQQSLYYKYSD